MAMIMLGLAECFSMLECSRYNTGSQHWVCKVTGQKIDNANNNNNNLKSDGYNKKYSDTVNLQLNGEFSYICPRKRMRALKVLVAQILCDEVEIKNKHNRWMLF